MLRHRFILAGLVAAGALGFVGACTRSPSGPAQLRVNLVDAVPVGVDQIVVNVTKVTAHSSSDGWITVTTTPMTVDLLTLQSSPLALGLVKLTAGRITQLRLYVTKAGNYVHLTGDAPDVHTPLVVPSGYESGIKILGPWRVDACTRTAVTLDFDGQASLELHPTGTGSEWILRPVIRTKKTDTSPIACQDQGGGGTCDVETPCAEGQVCVGGTCVADKVGNGAGGTCTTDGDCLSSMCVGGTTCAKSPPNGPCRSSGDCMNGSCDADGSCAGCAKDGDCPMGMTCDPAGGSCSQPSSNL